MEYLLEYKQYGNVLLIVDVQKSFKKFFTDNYIKELKKHCENFSQVYQIFDNHIDGTDVSKEYLYDSDPDTPIHHDIFYFPNQKDIIEKRYNYDVDADFYRKILDTETYKIIKEKENKNTLRKGDMFKTKEETAIVYIGNKHKWFHVPKKLFKLLNDMKNETIEIVGGSENECLQDIYITAKSMKLNIHKNKNFIYSAKNCPIK